MNVFLRGSILAALAAGVVTAWTPAAHASTPMGVYARVDSVTYEPDKATATKIQIHGVFAVHQGGSGFDYSAPQAGYMYFACPAGSETDCRDQWGELESYAGNKNTCAGFGQQSKGFGTVRAEGTAAQAETYEIGLGVQPGQYVGGTCPKLLAYTPPSSGSSGTSGAGSNGGTTSGGTTNPPASSGGTETGGGSNPSPPSSPSSSTSSCAASPASAGSAIAFAAVIGAIIGFLARRKRSSSSSEDR